MLAEPAPVRGRKGATLANCKSAQEQQQASKWPLWAATLRQPVESFRVSYIGAVLPASQQPAKRQLATVSGYKQTGSQARLSAQHTRKQTRAAPDEPRAEQS